MYYYIDKSKHAPSGISLIISFEDTKKLKVSGYTTYLPIDYKILHDEAAYLGGEADDIIGNGIMSANFILTARQLIEKIFK